MRKLRDSVVVVTGASSGIGRATALAFADAGAELAVTARRREPLDDLVEEVTASGAKATAIPVDVTDADAVAALAQEVAAQCGRIDVWVNNAAVHLFGRLEEVPVTDWHRVVETNVFGYYHGVRAAARLMRPQGSGVIVNVGSVLSEVPAPLQSAYVVSKHAVKALSDSARQELAGTGVAVSTVLPGAIDTPLFQHAANYTGKVPKPPRPVIAPERVAAAIVSCAVKPRRDVTVGGSTRTALLSRTLLPGVTEKMVGEGMPAEHFLDEPAEPTSGNLHDPVEQGTDVRGGWKAREGLPLRKVVALGTVGVAAAATVTRLRQDD